MAPRSVDLPRVRSALEKLDATLATGARPCPERTAAWLQNDLPEGPMADTTDPISPTSLRVPRSFLDRADALVGKLGDDPTVKALAGARGVTRAVVLRLAVERGLMVLEAGAPPKMLRSPTGAMTAEGIRAELDALQRHIDGMRAQLPAQDGPA